MRAELCGRLSARTSKDLVTAQSGALELTARRNQAFSKGVGYDFKAPRKRPFALLTLCTTWSCAHSARSSRPCPPQGAVLTATRTPSEASVTRQLQATKSELLTTRTRQLLLPSASFFQQLPAQLHLASRHCAWGVACPRRAQAVVNACARACVAAPAALCRVSRRLHIVAVRYL